MTTSGRLASLRALRAVNGVVEAAGECLIENKPALEALLDSVSPGRKSARSVWPCASPKAATTYRLRN